MNAELFGALVMTMARYAGDVRLDPAATNDLLKWFGQAEKLWCQLEPVDDDDDGDETDHNGEIE